MQLQNSITYLKSSNCTEKDLEIKDTYTHFLMQRATVSTELLSINDPPHTCRNRPDGTR